MEIGKLYSLGDFKADTWVKVYETTLTEATSSITISNLDGNTDVEYRLVLRAKNDNANATTAGLRFNNDSGSNYGMQTVYGQNTTIAAGRSTGNAYIALSIEDYDQNKICFSVADIYAKSGYIRTVLLRCLDNTTATTVSIIQERGNVWNNIVDEVTSIVVFATQANGLGVGTYICLYKKVAKE